MRRKLIEVALPLDAINAASAREKSIRHGHPSTLHLWWARRPLAAARAVIFAQMVDDPSEYVDVLLSDAGKKRAAQRALKKRLAARASAAAAPPATGNGNIRDGEKPGATVEAALRAPTLGDVAAELERARLFGIVEELVLWENTTNEEVLKRARTEIWQSWRRACAENADHPRAAELFDRHTLPAFHDPFAGGGSLPLEAQRLGLEAHASDLNPVAVLINKAMIEIPPKFAGRPAVNPESQGEPTVIAKTWRGAQGLAEDVRHYGRWMRDEAEKRIGHLYPPVETTPQMVRERPDLKPYEGRKLTVIAWLWARTVKSPNPAFADVDVPLASTFMLSTKEEQGGIRRAGDRGTRVSVHGEGRRAIGCGDREAWDEIRWKRQPISVPDVRFADAVRLSASRSQGWADGFAINGGCGEGHSRPRLSDTDCRAGSRGDQRRGRTGCLIPTCRRGRLVFVCRNTAC